MTGKWAGDSYLPDWLEEGIESSLRDTEADIPQIPVHAVQSSAARSIASSSKASPVVLTPTGGVSPAGSFTKQETKAAYMDLDKFYEDTEEADDDSDSEASEQDEDDEDEDEDEDEDDATGSEEAETSEDESEDEEHQEQHGNHVHGTTG